jgi:hypothetical protein
MDSIYYEIAMLIELIITLIILTTLSIGINTHANHKLETRLLQTQIAATLYWQRVNSLQSHITTKTTAKNGTLILSAPLNTTIISYPKIPLKLNVKEIGFTPIGTTSKAGTLSIGDTLEITLPVGTGKPRIK